LIASGEVVRHVSAPEGLRAHGPVVLRGRQQPIEVYVPDGGQTPSGDEDRPREAQVSG
jgi:class 3 adenylate cyclase